MRRVNLVTNPKKTYTNLDWHSGSDAWEYYLDCESVYLPAGDYVLTCTITQVNSDGHRLQIWNENAHKQLYDNVPSAGEQSISFTNPSDGKCHVAILGGELKDCSIESADTYSIAVGGGFRASSPETPCHSANPSHQAGDRR